MGLTISQACEEAGIEPASYRHWIAEHPETIQVMQKSISTIERLSLMEIVHASSALLDQIIVDSQRTDLPPRTKVELHSYLTRLQDDIEQKHGTGIREDIRAKEFLLKGPTTRRAESRTTVNIKPMSDGSVDITVMKAEDIIDAIEANSIENPSLDQN